MFYLSLYYSIFYPFMIFKATYKPIHKSGRMESILDPTWNRSTGIGWKVEGLETDYRHQLVKSISSSSEGHWNL